MYSSHLIDILFLLGASVITVPLFQAMRLGTVPGFLAAGIIVGPSGLALIDNVDNIVHLAEIGVVLLLFVIGIELKPSRLWLMRRQVFGLGGSQVLLGSAALTAAGHFLFALPWPTAMLVGPALALSSTAFVLQILAEQKALMSPYGRASFAVLLLQDLAVVPLLALVPLLAMTEMGAAGNIGLALIESVAILVLVVVVGRYALHPLLYLVARSGSSEVLTASAVLIVLGAAMATEYAGLSMAMGAFLAGLLMSESAYRHQVTAEIQPFRGLLLGLFFMSMGMLFDLGLLLENPLTAIGLAAGLIAVKAAILFPLARLFGLDSKPSLAISLLLAQSGEFALVIFALARQLELLTPRLFGELLLVVLLSMLVTPALAQLARKVAAPKRGAAIAHEEAHAPAPIVLAGYGRVGRRVGEILARGGRPFVALDCDASIVAHERAQGHPVYFGDASQPGLLKSMGAADAGVIVVTLNDPDATSRLVATLRDLYPSVQILARGHNLEACRQLMRMGAAGVVSENVEASLELSRMTLERSGVEESQREDILSAFRQQYHDQIHAREGGRDSAPGGGTEPGV